MQYHSKTRAEVLRLTACVPDVTLVRWKLSSKTLLDVGHGVELRSQELSKKGDVGDGQAQGVDLAEALLVREGGYVRSQLLEGWVYTAGGRVGTRIITTHL